MFLHDEKCKNCGKQGLWFDGVCPKCRKQSKPTKITIQHVNKIINQNYPNHTVIGIAQIRTTNNSGWIDLNDTKPIYIQDIINKRLYPNITHIQFIIPDNETKSIRYPDYSIKELYANYVAKHIDKH